jgi:hypothetical protein
MVKMELIHPSLNTYGLPSLHQGYSILRNTLAKRFRHQEARSISEKDSKTTLMASGQMCWICSLPTTRH